MPDRPKTALITGASSGIGVDFARLLARRKFDLVITARRTELLASLKKELQDEFGVEVFIIPCDLSSSVGAKQLFHDVQQLDRPITLLVNNAGLGKFGPTLKQSLSDIEAMIQVNLVSLTVLTRLFAADMKKQGGGYILNNASFSAIQPTPSYAVYSGTKAYVLAFSQALRSDLRQSKVKVSVLCAGFFDSEFFQHSGQKPSFIVWCIMLNRLSVARAGISGVLRGKAVIIPGLVYKFLNLIMRLLPRSLATDIADFSVHNWINKKEDSGD